MSFARDYPKTGNTIVNCLYIVCMCTCVACSTIALCAACVLCVMALYSTVTQWRIQKGRFQTNECAVRVVKVELRPLPAAHCAVRLGKIPILSQGKSHNRLPYIELASSHEQSTN